MFVVEKHILRAELKVFYSHNDFKQLSVIEDVCEWNCEYGILDKEFEKLYGISLTNFAKSRLNVNEEVKKKRLLK